MEVKSGLVKIDKVIELAVKLGKKYNINSNFSAFMIEFICSLYKIEEE